MWRQFLEEKAEDWAEKVTVDPGDVILKEFPWNVCQLLLGSWTHGGKIGIIQWHWETTLNIILLYFLQKSERSKLDENCKEQGIFTELFGT